MDSKPNPIITQAVFNRMQKDLANLTNKDDKTDDEYIRLHSITILLSTNSIENYLFNKEYKKLLELNKVAGTISIVLDKNIIKVARLSHTLFGEHYVHSYSVGTAKPVIFKYKEFISHLQNYIGEKIRVLDNEEQKDFKNTSELITYLNKLMF